MSTHIRQNSRSISFRRSSSSLKETRAIDIIFQRFQLYRYLMIFLSSRSKGEEDDVIHVRHMPRINAKDINEIKKYDWNLMNLEFYIKGKQSINPTHPYEIVTRNGELHINSYGDIPIDETNKVDRIVDSEGKNGLCNSDSVKHKDSSETKDRNDKFDIESGNIMSVVEIEDENISELEFRRTCYESSNICASYAKIFLFFEFISKAADLCAVIFLPIAIEIGISVDVVIILVCIFIPVILMQVLCDWGKLTEKYSELVYHFYVLASSKDDDKIIQYEKLVGQFRSKWLYCDNLPMKNIPLPDVKSNQEPIRVYSSDNITSQFIPSEVLSPILTEHIK